MAFNIKQFAENLTVKIMKTIKPKLGLKADKSQVLTNVPVGALFTDTIYTDENAQDAVNTMLQNGTHTNITVTYDDAGNAISLAGSASTTNLTDEQVQDIIGGGIFGGNGVTVTYDDDANKINISLAGEQLTATLLTKLNGIEEGANKYVHPTGAGDSHVPANGTTNAGKVLVAGATEGSFTWEVVEGVTNTTDLTQAEVDTIFDNA